jgi:RND family efflux transporter MFP subunit
MSLKDRHMAGQRSRILGYGVAATMLAGIGLLVAERQGVVKSGLASYLPASFGAAAAVNTAQPGAPKAAPSGPPGPGGPPGAGGPPPGVTVAAPLTRKIVEWDEYTGRFDAVESVDIRARVSGYLNEVNFRDGQIIKKGDLLYSIDPRPFERALEQAKAELAQATTKIENTSLDVERGKPLVDRKIMSEKVFDDRANALRDAQASMKVADAKVKTAELDLFFTKVTAPVGGRISKSNISAGSWVSGGAAANSSLLTSIVSESPIHIYFDISENNWIKYRRLIDKGTKQGAAQLGSMVEIGLPDENGYPHRGKVDFLDNRLDQATGTMRGRAIVENAKGTFSPGMFARVRVQGSDEYNAILLPDEAIGTDQTNKFALTVSEDGTVARKTVVLGPMIDGMRVIRTGLATTDTVITKGLQRARPGGKVSPKREELKTAGGPPPAPTPGGASKAPAKTQ